MLVDAIVELADEPIAQQRADKLARRLFRAGRPPS